MKLHLAFGLIAFGLAVQGQVWMDLCAGTIPIECVDYCNQPNANGTEYQIWQTQQQTIDFLSVLCSFEADDPEVVRLVHIYSRAQNDCLVKKAFETLGGTTTRNFGIGLRASPTDGVYRWFAPEGKTLNLRV